MKKLVSILLVAILCCAFVLPAMAEEKIHLTYSGFGYDDESTNEQKALNWGLSNYVETHKETVEVEVTSMSHDDYQTKMLALAAADDLPDVMIVKGSWLEDFAENGLLADLTDYAQALPYYSDYNGGSFDWMTYKGRIYGAPRMHAGGSSMVFYNEEIWKEAGYETFPATFEELFAAAEKIAPTGLTPLVFANGGKWEFECCMFSLIANRYTGDEWFESIKMRDGKASFTDECFIKALEFAQKLGTSTLVNPDYNMLDYQGAIDVYCQGKAAALVSGSGNLYIETNGPEGLAEKTKMVTLPLNEDAAYNKPDAISNAAGWFVGVNAKLTGAELEAAMEMAFALNGKEVCEYAASTFGNPTWIAVDVELPEVSPLTTKMLDFYSTYPVGVPIYDCVLDGSIIDVLNTGLQEVLAGTMEPMTLAQQLQEVQLELAEGI